MQNKLLTRPDLVYSRKCFEWACAYSRAHAVLAADALERYGDHGAQVSGCVREHFPEDVKASLRILARRVTAHSNCAYDYKPRRVHVATIRALGRAVAARDGSGFYGPQP